MKKIVQSNLRLIGLLSALAFLLASIAFIAAYTPQQRGIQPRAASSTFTASTSDGHLVVWANNIYPPEPNNCSSRVDADYIEVGQAEYRISETENQYAAERSYLAFNTSSIPLNATISSVVLRLTRKGGSFSPDFYIRVRSFNWGSSLGCNDWGPGTGTPDTFHTSNRPGTGQPFDIILNTLKVVKGGTTQLSMVSDREENNVRPEQMEYILIYSANSSYPPQLIVSYTVPDTTPPSAPTNLRSTAKTTTSISLAWSASTDTGGSGLAGYKVYRNNKHIKTTTSTSYKDSGLSASTTYSYYVRSYDKAGNPSGKSNTISVTTKSPPQPPGPEPGPSPGPAPLPPVPDGKVDPNNLNYLKLKINVPFLLGKMKIPVVIGGFTKEIEVSPGSHEYKIDVRGAKFKLGKEVTIVAGGNGTLTKKIKVKTKAPTMPVKVGNLDLGDMNEDNSVNEQDALLLLKSIASQATKGDINLDKVANSLDWAILFVNFGKRGSK